uniref:Uncharacterized protein n=1 Tax=Prolemur simus TaxID=1328070 RepID=A0A8C8YFY7_PROSS
MGERRVARAPGDACVSCWEQLLQVHTTPPAPAQTEPLGVRHTPAVQGACGCPFSTHFRQHHCMSEHFRTGWPSQGIRSPAQCHKWEGKGPFPGCSRQVQGRHRACGKVCRVGRPAGVGCGRVESCHLPPSTFQ